MSTTALYQALIDAGTSRETAEKAVEGIHPAGEVATKIDIAELRADMATMETRFVRWLVTTEIATSAVVIAAVGLIVKL